MKIPRNITFILFSTPTTPTCLKEISVNHVESVIVESGKERSRKKAGLEVEACCVSSPCVFRLLLRAAELGCGVVEVALSTSGKLVLFFLGELRFPDLRELGLIAVAGLQLQREMEGDFPWRSHAWVKEGLMIEKS